MQHSFIKSANDRRGPFPLNNLPFCVCKPTKSDSPIVCVAIGDHLLNLAAVAAHTPTIFCGPLLPASNALATFSTPSLNSFLELGRSVWIEIRAHLIDALSIHPRNPCIKDASPAIQAAILPRIDAIDSFVLPVRPGDYTDFYSSLSHARNVGTMFRGAENALPPNWLHMPIAYHGRASSVIVSGTSITRPKAQISAGTDEPSSRLDFELEMAVIIGGDGNPLGTRVSVDEAAEKVFGFALLNDWSARDVQKWEYVPLGPFAAKNFATTISPFVVTLEALKPFRQPSPRQVPPPLPYLNGKEGKGVHCSFDVELQVAIAAREDRLASVVCKSNLRHLYWTVAQQVAHHTVTGCNLRPGDLLGSGTISGDERKLYYFYFIYSPSFFRMHILTDSFIYIFIIVVFFLPKQRGVSGVCSNYHGTGQIK